jgi:hypothetical protein
MEEITIEKVDTIRSRTGLSYAEAKAALENNNGNVVDTLIYLENNKKSFTDNMSDAGADILTAVKEIIKKGNVNRIKIKRDNTVLVDIPVNAGIAVGALTLFAPLILAIGTVTAIASKITIEIERPDGSIEVINDLVKNTFDQTVEKAKDFANDMNHKRDSSDNNKEYIDLNKKENVDNEKDVDHEDVDQTIEINQNMEENDENKNE